MTQTPTAASTKRRGAARRFLSRVGSWFPTEVTRPVVVFAWLSIALQIVLIGTGGAVRLTASGLGCPTWPNCDANSFVPTPELGIHGVIEFTNRMLTFVLSIVVIVMFLIVLRLRRDRPDLFRFALVQGLSIPFQAVLGGISVLSGLNPYVVGSHFLVSILLVILTTNLVYRALDGRRGGPRRTPRWFVVIGVINSVFVGLTVIVGVLTTGAGPHAGDNSNAKKLAPRNGLPPVILQQIHEIPAFVTFGLTILMVIIVLVARWKRVRLFALALLVVEIAQIIVGLVQAKLGLPIALVNIHLVLAAILVAAMTAVMLSLRASRGVAPVLGSERGFALSASRPVGGDTAP